jgi:hypothetical protein
MLRSLYRGKSPPPPRRRTAGLDGMVAWWNDGMMAWCPYRESNPDCLAHNQKLHWLKILWLTADVFNFYKHWLFWSYPLTACRKVDSSILSSRCSVIISPRAPTPDAGSEGVAWSVADIDLFLCESLEGLGAVLSTPGFNQGSRNSVVKEML